MEGGLGRLVSFGKVDEEALTRLEEQAVRKQKVIWDCMVTSVSDCNKLQCFMSVKPELNYESWTCCKSQLNKGPRLWHLILHSAESDGIVFRRNLIRSR